MCLFARERSISARVCCVSTMTVFALPLDQLRKNPARLKAEMDDIGKE
jgi:hypothetical protein